MMSSGLGRSAVPVQQLDDIYLGRLLLSSLGFRELYNAVNSYDFSRREIRAIEAL